MFRSILLAPANEVAGAVYLSTKGGGGRLPSHNIMGQADPLRRQAPYKRSTGGRYASYWNADLFLFEFIIAN